MTQSQINNNSIIHYQIKIDYLDNVDNSYHFLVEKHESGTYKVVLQQRSHLTKQTTDLFQFPYMQKFNPKSLIETLHKPAVKAEVMYFYVQYT